MNSGDGLGADQQKITAGVLLVDKPVGFSSFAMVQRVRRILGIKEVGHAGTLDPFASGLLIICAGRPATKQIDRFMQGEKTYVATLRLGVETTTLDPEGEITATNKVPVLQIADIEACLAQFRGPQLQAPPAFSAAKYKGKPLYHYARKGIMIEKEPKAIEIYDLHCTAMTSETVEIKVCCSRGTYIRVLAADIGTALGCGAHLTCLRRTTSGPFMVEHGFSGDALQDKCEKEQLLESMMTIEEAVAEIEKGCG